MSNRSPLVSVIIPVYNGERYLAAAITSVLAQTHQPLEVIVIDDGSVDGSAAVARSFGEAVRYAAQTHAPHGGAASARNLGVTLAHGDLLAFLDADDLWTPEKLARQVALLTREPEIDSVFGAVQQFISPELPEEVRATIDCPPGAAPGYTHAAMLIRREAFARIAPFDTGWRVGEFIDWRIRAGDAGVTSAMLPEVVLLRRLHTTNQGVLKRDARLDYVRIVKAALDRRRATTGESADQDAGAP